MGRWIAAGSLLAMLVLAAPAVAADRYASPTGGGAEPCAQAAPCTVTAALQGPGAAAGDVVHLAGGDYVLAASAELTRANVTMSGPASGPRARLTSTGAAAVLVDATGITLRDFDVVTTDAGGSGRAFGQNAAATGLLAERLRITAVGSTGTAALLQGGPSTVVRDSLVRGTTDGNAVLVGRTGATLVNVTARASGPASVGLLLSSDFMADATSQSAAVTNAILEGGLDDVRVEGTASRTIALAIDHSNFASPFVAPAGSTLTDGGGNQTAEPAFGADGVTQATGSPTIDAGAAGPRIGPSDLFGGARTSGPAPDIGAHEVQVPPAAPATPQQPQPPAPPAPAPPSPGPGRVTPGGIPLAAPRLSAVSLSRTRFRAGTRRVRLRWSLSQNATLTLTVRHGTRRVGRSRTITARRGRGSVAFTGRGLRPGRYVLSIVADAGGRRSSTRRVRFTITSP